MYAEDLLGAGGGGGWFCSCVAGVDGLALGAGCFWTGGRECFVFRSMAYQLNGTIKLIYDTQTFPSGFSKREFVVTTDDKFPQDIKLDVPEGEGGASGQCEGGGNG